MAGIDKNKRPSNIPPPAELPDVILSLQISPHAYVKEQTAGPNH